MPRAAFMAGAIIGGVVLLALFLAGCIAEARASYLPRYTRAKAVPVKPRHEDGYDVWGPYAGPTPSASLESVSIYVGGKEVPLRSLR